MKPSDPLGAEGNRLEMIAQSRPIPNNQYTYEVEYIRFYKVNTPEHSAEKDSRLVQANSPQEAFETMRQQCLVDHKRDNNWSYQIFKHSITEIK